MNTLSKWVGGPNYHKVGQWGSGKSNNNDKKKGFGAAGMRKRIRFNPNPTMSDSTSDPIRIQADKNRKAYSNRARAAT